MDNKSVSGSYRILDEKAKKAQLTVCIGYDGNGKQIKKRKNVTYSKKKDLKDMLRDFENEVASGRCAVGDDITIKEMMNKVIASKRALGIRDTTLRGYDAARKKIVSHFGERAKAKNVNLSDINEWIEDMIEEGLSPKTIRNYHSFLYNCYEKKINDRTLWMDNPCHGADLPRANKKDREILTLDQIGSFTKAYHDYFDDYDLIVTYDLALYCGLRRSEILGLTWDAIDLESGTLTIKQTRQVFHAQTYIEQPKTEKSRRTIQIPMNVINDIRKLYAQHASEKLRYFVTGYTDDFVIVDDFGQAIGVDRVRRALKKFEKDSNFPAVTLHGLRHTYASMLNNFGSDLTEISAQLGHSNTTITANVYVHMFEKASHVSRRIADNIDRFIASNEQ